MSRRIVLVLCALFVLGPVPAALGAPAPSGSAATVAGAAHRVVPLRAGRYIPRPPADAHHWYYADTWVILDAANHELGRTFVQANVSFNGRLARFVFSLSRISGVGQTFDAVVNCRRERLGPDAGCGSRHKSGRKVAMSNIPGRQLEPVGLLRQAARRVPHRLPLVRVVHGRRPGRLLLDADVSLPAVVPLLIPRRPGVAPRVG